MGVILPMALMVLAGAAAERFLQAFAKQAEHYPMKADVESERALMVLAAQMAAKR